MGIVLVSIMVGVLKGGVAAAITPRPCGPRKRAVMIMATIPPIIQ